MFTRQNRGDAAGFVCLNIGFAGFKINGAALLSCLCEHLIKRIEIFDVRIDLMNLVSRSFLILERVPHLGIGQAGVRINETGIELIGRHFTLRVNQRVAHHCAAVDLRVQRAETV